MLRETRRILKPGGLLYTSTVIKKMVGGLDLLEKRFKLDPTHVKEYKSEKEFLKLLKKAGLKP